MSQVLGHSLNSNRTKDVITEGNVTFESLLLNGDVLKGLEQSGFRKPSPIQVKAIPIGRCGFDIIVRSKSGTGKTLVYSLIALENVDTSRNETQVLIMAPTREVVVQIQEVLTSIGKYINGLQVKSFIGGLPIHVDKENCNACHIAVGTPGRIKHLISDGCLKTNSIRLFALDEVDKLMESSFVNDVNDIYNSLPGRIQIVTTSATYTDELEGFLQKYMLSPIQIVVEDTTPLLWGLKQFAVVLKPHTNVVQQMKIKTEEILEILSRISFTQCIIFTNYQTRAESVSNMLNQKGWNSSYISAAKSQSERLAALASLKRFNCRILLSTDLTARGIDVANIDLVINYDVPVDAVTYLHRMGRAGRFGSLGACINLVSEGPDVQKLQNILGTIGGPTFSIPLLPDFNGNVLDLINEKVHCESHLCATTESSANIPDIKKEVLSVKEVGHVPKQDEQQRGSGEDSSGVDKTAEDEIMDFLNGTKKEAACMSEQLNLEEASALLKQIASGEAVELNSVCDSAPVSSKLREALLRNVEEAPLRCESVTTNKVGKDELSEKEILYRKNVALFSVSKIISDSECEIVDKDLDAIQEYLTILKDQERKEIDAMMRNGDRNEADILKNGDLDKLGINCDPSETKTNENLENIFVKGYNSAVKPNATHWRTYFPDLQLKPSNLHQAEQASDEILISCAKEEFVADIEVQNFEASSSDDKKSLDDFMRWVPVEKPEKKNRAILDSGGTGWERYYGYFNGCSEHLWQNGLCFESVQDFDDWFYHDWQRYVCGVRNYVQQNVYVEELSRYREEAKNLV